ncbi:60S ribosomal protein L3 [Spraguea lophii 42_110]|uniref:60S ribosomal protein L3 n=1 Tax=Spraguea lophii (strain 42_110) TaxID=1358809 RepID=S7XFB1_SPRLO|nr:Chain LB0, 60S ribosomal protein L3 [Spraguea lophii 42_110]7QJH_KB0 Chain KB0, 60S ribosomal protein L3 [Spraguea lophii 42_110]7QJH_LB0 Chain LB0, 60S ribosomal protein L3 [Spraguea lophii 42_110]8BR3_LB0 Chain LB0, 60S ribosomal protein L3 [Spraguea lophii 42_110]8P5D_LB0 Chain LB0, 60S ribosomal protein L3 [Spraguea lophii 42_110]8P60_KB0 Chain KB0, 60S ribosomal protein L3 [Spraguea lophii 42_110]8P60_LB0 Chain LB0, 60S ribosomal protein L3 [Spraguea lophii 42_110]EPR77719.1 60S ribo
MSCRNYSAPRHGSLAYCPKKRAKTTKPAIKSFPKDDASKPVHLTGYLAYKVGMTHVVRLSTRRSKTERVLKETQKEVLDAVTILEVPAMRIFGMVGYKSTVNGLKAIKTVYAEHLDEQVLARLRKRNSRSSKLMFKLYPQKYENGDIKRDYELLKRESDVVRVLAHTQVSKIPSLNLKKAHILEIQLNGGTIEEKIEWAIERLEKEIPVSEVFSQQDLIDVIGVTKGKGKEGTTKRFGTTILQHKSRKGKRKVACIGAWHPANVRRTVARAGQLGFHRRTAQNKKIYMMGNGKTPFSTEYDLTSKTINPMGGFLRYGNVKSDFIMVKGGIQGPSKRVLALRKAFAPSNLGKDNEEIVLKFVDASSKKGYGRFQTTEEKKAYFGIKKAEVVEQ